MKKAIYREKHSEDKKIIPSEINDNENKEDFIIEPVKNTRRRKKIEND